MQKKTIIIIISAAVLTILSFYVIKFDILGLERKFGDSYGKESSKHVCADGTVEKNPNKCNSLELNNHYE